MAAEIDRERWQRVSPILEAALELPAEARTAYLDETCAGDADLRRHVEELLAAEASAGSFLAAGALERGAPLVAEMAGHRDASPSAPTGRLVGVYRLVAELGEGGMGTVHLAERVDGHFEQRVAIKLLKQGLADDDAKRRFLQERQILARLDHPGIARLIDGGVTAEGTPFFVMERVEGRPVTTYCDEQGFGIEQRLRVFLEICDAVQYAHHALVIHRDIKPSNILVDAAGRVKLLDFGIAKLLAGTGGSPQEATRTFVRAMTPEYAAPEQVRNEPVTAATDVYSLGVLLYELLTGQRPYKMGRGGLSEMERAILEQEPERPSARTGTARGPMGTGTTRSTRRRLRGDLDKIVLKALEKAPERRYPTAQALAADIRRHLDGLPITARGDSVLYRVRKFVRRHGAGVAASVMAGVAAVLLAVVAVLVARDRPINSLAVLPFANASRDADAQYLGDGLTDSLIDQMSRVPSLRVMARATVFRFKGAADPQEAGRKLGVGAVVTGTVSRRGDRIAISAELIEIATGARLWGEQYDRPFTELLSVQNGIASEISDGLRLRLTGQEKRTLGQHGTENPEAYELFLKGRFFLTRDNEEDELQARRLFLQALEKDPRFADARLGVAATYARSAGSGYARPAEAWARVEEEARKALALDPGNVRARLALANRRFAFDWDWAGSEREFGELSPDPQVVLGPQFHAIAGYFWARGWPQQSVALVERALRVDPQNLESRIMMADYLAQAGRLEEAMDHYRAIARDEPTKASPLFGLAEVLRRRGDPKGAIDALRKAYELSGEEQGAKALATARTEQDYENAELAVARVRLADLEALAKERYVSPLDFARLYATVGEHEKAFASLEAALSERSTGLVYLKVDHAWDPIRDDPRFTAVVRRVGIP